MTTTKTKARARRTGQYALEGNWNRICARCGGTLGNHDAEAPHANYDLTNGPACEGFKVSRAKAKH